MSVHANNTKNAESFTVLTRLYFSALAVNHYSPATIKKKREHLNEFIRWCEIRELHKPSDITQGIAESYQKHLHHHRKQNGQPLGINTQRLRLTSIKMFYRWLVKSAYLAYSPLESMSMPILPKQLPRAVLSEEESEKVLAQPDIDTPTGLRDRAIMETLYSSGLRRAEVLNLQVNDLDRERGLLRVNEGKGRKDRIVPIGERALAWIARYQNEARYLLLKHINEPALFISRMGKPLSTTTLTRCFRGYVRAAGINKSGSVHIFRHTTATLMLENGADIRHIQALLGHESLSTTQIYTHVAISHLKDVHNHTHPATKPLPDKKDRH